MSMKLNLVHAGLLAALTGAALMSGCAAEKPPAVSYTKQVKPILDAQCVECHKQGAAGYEASGLLMDSYAGLMKGTQFGRIVIPGDSLTSILVALIEGRADASIRMPHGKAPLSAEEIALIKTWVEQGATTTEARLHQALRYRSRDGSRRFAPTIYGSALTALSLPPGREQCDKNNQRGPAAAATAILVSGGVVGRIKRGVFQRQPGQCRVLVRTEVRQEVSAVGVVELDQHVVVSRGITDIKLGDDFVGIGAVGVKNAEYAGSVVVIPGTAVPAQEQLGVDLCPAGC